MKFSARRGLSWAEWLLPNLVSWNRHGGQSSGATPTAVAARSPQSTPVRQLTFECVIFDHRLNSRDGGGRSRHQHLTDSLVYADAQHDDDQYGRPAQTASPTARCRPTVDVVRHSALRRRHSGLWQEGRISVRAGTLNFALAVQEFRVKEGMPSNSPEFSIPNTPQFDLPNASIGSAQAGMITGIVGTPRQIQLGGKLVF